MNNPSRTWVIAQACKKIAGGPNLPTIEPGPLATDHATGEPQLMWTARIKKTSAEACCPEDALSDLLTKLLNGA